MIQRKASSLVNVASNKMMQTILDRSKDVNPVITKLMAHWGYDLYKRKPGPAYTDDGVFQGTDLDMACFLSAFVDRGAVLNIPSYTSRRAKTHRENERVHSAENRHGKIKGLVANKDVFSFGLLIEDMNVITTDKVGASRNFMLLDIDGTWHDGWKRIEFMPTAKENDFLNDKKLWDGHTVTFNHFIHPNRWTSFYGQYYFVTKALLDRIGEESKWIYGQMKELIAQGVELPEEEKPSYGESVTEEGKKIKVKTLESKIQMPTFSGEFALPKIDDKVQLLIALRDRRKAFVYRYAKALRFFTRATEYAFFKHGFKDESERFPSWIQNVNWEREYKESARARTKWNRLEIAPDIGILYRTKEKTETVSIH